MINTIGTNIIVSSKLQTIQILRGVAAFMVLYFHAAAMANDFAGYRFPYTNGGAAGVDIFFLISGFVITYITQKQPTSAARFFLNRMVRIAPLYWFYTSATIVIALTVPNAYRRLHVDFSYALQSYAFLLSQTADGSVGTVLGVGWTLAYEFYFYVLMSALLFLPSKMILPSLATIFLLGAIVGERLAVPAFATVFTSGLPLEFLAGCITAQIYLGGKRLPVSLILPAILLGAFAIWWASAQGWVNSDHDLRRPVFFGIPALMIFVGVLSLDDVKSVQFPRWAILIGDASYSLYLCHQFVLIAIGKIWKTLSLENYFAVHILLIISMAVAIVTALFSYFWIEYPITNALKKISRNMSFRFLFRNSSSDTKKDTPR